jgi:site-specific DNA-methyltransferase (adenine-specific)
MLQLNKIYEGDCRVLLPEVSKLSIKPVGIITDFPYGVDFQSNFRTKTEKYKKIENDKWPFVDKWIFQSFKITKLDAFFLTFYRYDVQDILFEAIESAGWHIKSQLVWSKGGGAMGDLNSSFCPSFEVAVFCTKGKWKFPEGRPDAMLPSNKVASAHILHPNEKPLALGQHLVRVLTRKGDLIIDPFSGSSCFAAAAVSEGRYAIGFEKDSAKQTQIGGLTWTEYGNKRLELNKVNSNKIF